MADQFKKSNVSRSMADCGRLVLMTYQLKADQLMADKLKALSIYCRLSEGRYHLMTEQ